MTEFSRRDVLEGAIAGIGVAALPSIARADDEVTGHGNLLLPSSSQSAQASQSTQAGPSTNDGDGNKENVLANRGNLEPPMLHEMSVTFKIGSGSEGPTMSAWDRGGWDYRVGEHQDIITERANEKLMQAGVDFVANSVHTIERIMQALISGPSQAPDPDLWKSTFGVCTVLDALKPPAQAPTPADLWNRIAKPFQWDPNPYAGKDTIGPAEDPFPEYPDGGTWEDVFGLRDRPLRLLEEELMENAIRESVP
jgi:hypothetical protein